MEQPAAHVPLPFFPISQMFGPLLGLNTSYSSQCVLKHANIKFKLMIQCKWMLNTSECLPTIITNCLKCSQEGVLVRETSWQGYILCASRGKNGTSILKFDPDPS